MNAIRSLDAQQEYWDGVAASAEFTHPLNLFWLTQHIRKSDLVLDFGCGYGRILMDLSQAGYTCLTGLDTSPKMLARAARLNPGVTLVQADSYPTQLASRSFHCVVLFSVLSCQVQDLAQKAIIAEVRRIIRPGGIIYVADFPLQKDSSRVERYERYQPSHGIYGVFETADGAVMRHLNIDRFRELMSGFSELKFETRRVRTMHDNEADGIQFLGRLSK